VIVIFTYKVLAVGPDLGCGACDADWNLVPG